MGGWNKGLTKYTNKSLEQQSISSTGKKASSAHIEKLKNRPKECYKKPQASEYIGNELCNYGCGQIAKFIFKSEKLCCSTSHNSCPKKRQNFSELDHTESSRKSLATRIEKGITKSSQIKATQTRKENGHYEKLAITMQEHWQINPHNNLGPRGEWIMYKDTDIPYQASYEYSFLENLEKLNGLNWLIENVKRGPAIWYIDPCTEKKRLYISDYIIDSTIYEVKSSYTWNRKGKDLDLENLNKAKLDECLARGYNVVLVLDKKEIKYEKFMGGDV